MAGGEELPRAIEINKFTDARASEVSLRLTALGAQVKIASIVLHPA